MKHLIFFIALLFVSMPVFAQKKMSETGYSAQNLIQNGGMDIAQRGATPAAAGNALVYGPDRFFVQHVGVGSAGFYQETATPPTDNVVRYYGRAFVNAANTSYGSGDVFSVTQRIEGYNIRHLFGKTVTLSFWTAVNHSGATFPKTYHVAFRGAGQTRMYLAPLVINANATWEYKTITVQLDPTATTATWEYTTSPGLEVTWALACGSSRQTPTVGSWHTVTAGVQCASTVDQSFMGSAGNYIRLTKVMLNGGDRPAPFVLAGGDIAGELAKVQRYYVRGGYGYGSDLCSAGTLWTSAAGSASRQHLQVFYPVQMRITPTVYTCNDANQATGGTTGTGAYSYGIDTVGNYTNGQMSGSSTLGFNLLCNSGSASYPCRFGYRADAEL